MVPHGMLCDISLILDLGKTKNTTTIISHVGGGLVSSWTLASEKR